MTHTYPSYLHSRRRMSAVMACFHPFFKPETFEYEISSPNTFQLKCATWGDIGQLIFNENQREESSFSFTTPTPPPPEKAYEYYTILGTERLGAATVLAYADGKDDLVAQRCAEALHRICLARQEEFITWLSSRLRIFGYHTFYTRYTKEMPKLLEESFDFPLQGTPAQFGVMVQSCVPALQYQPDFRQLGVQLTLPTGRKDAGSLPSDTNPVALKLTQSRNQCFLHAHLVPSGGSRLHVHLKGSKDLWKLWDEIRDELVRLGWFTFPELPEVQETPIVSQPEPAIEIQAQPQAPEVEKWMLIPDVGVNREIVHLFYEGYTYRQIGDRVDRDEKTINKKISLLRKEHGEDIVPYRRSKPTKKTENDQEDPGRDISGTSSEYFGT